MTAVSAEDLIIELEPGASADCADLADTLRRLDVDRRAPEGTTPAPGPHKWGQAAFLCGDVFVKARYECTPANRSIPFIGTSRETDAARLALSVGLPTAALLGRFSVRKDGLWLWSGTLYARLIGYAHPDESPEGVATVLRAVDMACRLGISHPDMHAGNVLVKDKDTRLVDLAGLSLCSLGVPCVFFSMAQKYFTLRHTGSAKDQVRKYIYAL